MEVNGLFQAVDISNTVQILTALASQNTQNDFINWNFAGANLSNQNLTNFSTSFSNYAGMNISNSNFSNCTLTNCNLAGANLQNANLTNTTFNRTNLVQADLSGAMFSNTTFNQVNLDQTIFGNTSGLTIIGI